MKIILIALSMLGTVAHAQANLCDTSANIKINFGRKSVLGNSNSLIFTRDGFFVHSSKKMKSQKDKGYSYRFKGGDRFCYNFDVSHGGSGGGGKGCVGATQAGVGTDAPTVIEDHNGQPVAEVRELGRGLVEFRWNTSNRKGEFKRSEEYLQIFAGLPDAKDGEKPSANKTGKFSITSYDAKGRKIGTVTRDEEHLEMTPPLGKEHAVNLKERKEFSLSTDCPQKIVQSKSSSPSGGQETETKSSGTIN